MSHLLGLRKLLHVSTERLSHLAQTADQTRSLVISAAIIREISQLTPSVKRFRLRIVSFFVMLALLSCCSAP